MNENGPPVGMQATEPSPPLSVGEQKATLAFNILNLLTDIEYRKATFCDSLDHSGDSWKNKALARPLTDAEAKLKLAALCFLTRCLDGPTT